GERTRLEMSVLSWHGPLCGVRATSCSFCITTLSHPPEVKEKCPEREDQQILLSHVTSHAVRLRREGALLHVGHQPVGIRAETGVHQLVDGLRLERLAEHGQQMPLPLAPEERVGQVLEMLPALAWGIIPSTGG